MLSRASAATVAAALPSVSATRRLASAPTAAKSRSRSAALRAAWNGASELAGGGAMSRTVGSRTGAEGKAVHSSHGHVHSTGVSASTGSSTMLKASVVRAFFADMEAPYTAPVPPSHPPVPPYHSWRRTGSFFSTVSNRRKYQHSQYDML